MRLAIVLCLVTLAVDVRCYATFQDFLSNINSRVGYAFSEAWDSIVDAVKQPVRYHRLGPARLKTRGRSYTNYTIKSRREIPTTETIIKSQTLTPKLQYIISTPPRDRLFLPLIPKPIYNSGHQWLINQNPRFAFNFQRKYIDMMMISFATTSTTTQQTKSDTEQEEFGSLSFV